MQNQDAAWLLQEKYEGQDCPAYQADLTRLTAGEPLAYLIGHTPFLGCKIWLDSRPLIPRPETEYWVEKAIAAIKASLPPEPLVSDRRYVLDLCAGSGAIGVAIGHAVGFDAEVHFAELDETHHPTIRKNMHEAGIDDIRIPVFGGHLFDNLSSTHYASFRYHFILTNPPYIDPALDRATASVKNYEPHLALYGGEHGLALIAEIITKAPAHLHPQGQLWIEHEPEQAAAIASLGTAASFTVTTHPDQYNVPRYSVLVLQ